MIAQILRRDIDAYADRLRDGALLSAARAGRVTPPMVGAYLASVQLLLEHTPLHLRRARDVARARGLTRLARFFEDKLEEEQGHDRWAVSDREHLARVFGTAARQDPLPAIRRVVEDNEQTIDRSPHDYLAYILFAEYLTVVLGPEWVRSLVDCGVPRGALTAVTHHAELDRDHVADDCSLLDSLVDDPALLDSLRRSLGTTMDRFSAFCDAVHACAA